MARIYLSGLENFYYEVRTSIEGPSAWCNRAHLYADKAIVRYPSGVKVETVWLSNTEVGNRTERQLYSDMWELAQKYAKLKDTYVQYNPEPEAIHEALLLSKQAPETVHIHKERSNETPVRNTVPDSTTDKNRCTDLRLLRGLPLLAGKQDYRSQSAERRVFDRQ